MVCAFYRFHIFVCIFLLFFLYISLRSIPFPHYTLDTSYGPGRTCTDVSWSGARYARYCTTVPWSLPPELHRSPMGSALGCDLIVRIVGGLCITHHLPIRFTATWHLRALTGVRVNIEVAPQPKLESTLQLCFTLYIYLPISVAGFEPTATRIRSPVLCPY